MTRKDYRRIARVLSTATYAVAEGNTTALLGSLVSDMADMLQQDNPRFDREGFLAAVYPGTRASSSATLERRRTT